MLSWAGLFNLSHYEGTAQPQVIVQVLGQQAGGFSPRHQYEDRIVQSTPKTHPQMHSFQSTLWLTSRNPSM